MFWYETSRHSSRAAQIRRRIMQAGAAAFTRKDGAAVHLERDVLASAGVSVVGLPGLVRGP